MGEETNNDIRISKDDPSFPHATIVQPQYECPVHGKIHMAIMRVSYCDDKPMGIEFEHDYCILCFDDLLSKHCQIVKEIR